MVSAVNGLCDKEQQVFETSRNSDGSRVADLELRNARPALVIQDPLIRDIDCFDKLPHYSQQREVMRCEA